MAKLLSFVVNMDRERKGETVDVVLNKEGAEFMIRLLQSFVEEDRTEHWHLFSPEYGGDDLTLDDITLTDKQHLMNLVTVYYYNDNDE